MKTTGNRERSRDIIRVAASFEAAKGLLVLVTGFGLLLFLHKDIHAALEQIVRHLHLNPARHYPRIFIDAINHITDFQLVALALSAFAYSLIRFVEAYGLWKQRQWAEWFGFLSGGVYIPIELYELFHGITAVKAAIFGVNLFIVVFLGNALYQARQKS